MDVMFIMFMIWESKVTVYWECVVCMNRCLRTHMQ
jgi:hypothetical protein